MHDRRHYSDTYSEVATLKLCADCGFTPQDIDSLMERLEHVAAVYRWEKSKYVDLLSSSQQHKELIAVHKAAMKLSEAMQSLSWQPEIAIARQLENDSTSAFFAGSGVAGRETTLLRIANGDGTEGHVTIEPEDLKVLIPALGHAALDAASKLNKSRPGKQKAHGMHLWIANIAKTWSEVSDQPFTRDVASDGEPITNAARFCVGAFQMVDPELDRSVVLTAMKKLKAKSK
jgi:hypothetical protein